MIELIHVTRLPPSPSGVALYARDLDEAYGMLGHVSTHEMPPDPRASQSFPLAMKTWRRLRRRAVGRSDTIVSVELAGRGIAEMWAAWALARSRRRVWVTVHDAPTLCGPSFLSRSLDRRGARRLGVALSRTLGRPAERDLLRRAEQVMTLSQAGADALSEAYDLDREIVRLPHVLGRGPDIPTEPRILVPGYVGGTDSVLPLVRLLPALPEGWRLAIGAASDDVAGSVAALGRELGVAGSIELLGFVDEETMDREFARAAIVVRWRSHGWLSGTADYAVSGPLIRALGRGCAVVTNDRRGAIECLHAAGATVVADGEEGETEMTAAVSGLVHDSELRVRRARAGLVHIADEHSPQAVASRIAELLR
jgi:glycosyltransferase involved in cell wall biosynthesis